ncbi:hypothetical protein DFJ58DRAFT_805291 [Suillus subalutaceus]|uniref:uncharacterized protein n=1 Tax=Suillus subalutaceus TaxID=48586 RepID=UPI001B870DFF|nr:uncharacterized protein DFJ58DRAFT_805291 [Suillus subalutaceus]KAG1843010.1 hypothetical protein DFJ58DRAFT_805291 [Suillus subalutaceus]
MNCLRSTCVQRFVTPKVYRWRARFNRWAALLACVLTSLPDFGCLAISNSGLKIVYSIFQEPPHSIVHSVAYSLVGPALPGCALSGVLLRNLFPSPLVNVNIWPRMLLRKTHSSSPMKISQALLPFPLLFKSSRGFSWKYSRHHLYSAVYGIHRWTVSSCFHSDIEEEKDCQVLDFGISPFVIVRSSDSPDYA